MTDAERSALMYEYTRLRASLLAVEVKLAAEFHPDILREALGSVFDLAAVNDLCRRSMAVASEAQQTAHGLAADVRELHTEVHRDTDGLERRQEAILYELERAEKRCVRFHRLLDDLMGAAPGNGAPAKAEGVKRP